MRRITRKYLENAVLALFFACSSSVSPANIFRRDNNQLIPGTQGITPGPGIDLSGWGTPAHNLEFARLGFNMSGASFANSDLTSASFASFFGPGTANDLSSVSFVGTNLTNAILSNANLLSANFTNAIIGGTDLSSTTSHGFASGQLYGTASYTSGNLSGINLGSNTMGGWNFANENLTNAKFPSAVLTGADFTNANLINADFTNADLSNTILANANFSNSFLKGANMSNVAANGFTSAQFRSANSIVFGINLSHNDLTGWNFSKRILINSNFTSSNLAHANFGYADLRGATGWVPGIGTISTNAILPDGIMQNFSLVSGDVYAIRFDFQDMPVVIQNIASIPSGASLGIGGNGQVTSPGIINDGSFFTGQGPSTTNIYGQITGTGSVGTMAALVTDGVVASSLRLYVDQLYHNTSWTIRPNTGGASIFAGVSKLSALTLAGSPGKWTSRVDLTNNTLIVQTTDPADKAVKLVTLQNQIAQAADDGTWPSLAGITSSTVAADATTSQHTLGLALADNATLGLTTFNGQSVDENSLIIAPAHLGDSTLDGKVDAFDLNTIASHWQQSSGALWSDGDTTGPNNIPDGKVDAFDLNALATFWQFGSGSPIGSLPLAPPSSPIPEPASIALMALATPLLLRHRARR